MSDHTINQPQWPLGQRIRKVLIHYVDIGQLAPSAAKAYIDELKDGMSYRSVVEQLQLQGIAVIWVPVRPNCATRFECLDFDEEYPGCHPVKFVGPLPEDDDPAEPPLDTDWLEELKSATGVQIEIEDDRN